MCRPTVGQNTCTAPAFAVWGCALMVVGLHGKSSRCSYSRANHPETTDYQAHGNSGQNACPHSRVRPRPQGKQGSAYQMHHEGSACCTALGIQCLTPDVSAGLLAFCGPHTHTTTVPQLTIQPMWCTLEPRQPCAAFPRGQCPGWDFAEIRQLLCGSGGGRTARSEAPQNFCAPEISLKFPAPLMHFIFPRENFF